MHKTIPNEIQNKITAIREKNQSLCPLAFGCMIISNVMICFITEASALPAVGYKLTAPQNL